MDKADVAIIGAGVIGLAVAAELAERHPGRAIYLFEQHESFGKETSSRNSEIIHAGIYYTTGTLKAKLCVEGKQLLYDFCEQWGVPYRKSGKLIVAGSEEEVASLEGLLKQAAANGVHDLQELGAQQVARLEPNVKACEALYSPSSGIVNAHVLMSRLEQQAMQKGALPAYCHRVHRIEPLAEGYRIYFQNPDGSKDHLDCLSLINSAGLQADSLAATAGIDIDEAGYRQYFCKGEYFSLPPAYTRLVNRHIYPPPLKELTGLGIHLTCTLDGRLRLGPSAIYIDEEDYSVDPESGALFFEAVKNFLPFVKEDDLTPEMAGLRPKLSGPGEPFRDYIIKEEKDRGLPGMVNLLGIESPGLTAALAIARLAAKKVSI